LKLKLLNLKNKTKQELNQLLATLNEKQTKDLKEQQEYYLLCYPQGTGDSELEGLLADLDELWYPEYYNEQTNSNTGGDL
jgi:hypothetical protein